MAEFGRPSVGIVGLGHIGASLALRLGRRGPLAVIDEDPEAVAWVRERTSATVGWDAVSAAEIVVVATPTPVVGDVLCALGERGARGLVLDVASVKRPVVDAAPAGLRHLSVHPMAGREGHGAASADPSIWDGASWAFVLHGSESDDDVATALEFVFGDAGAGAVVALDATAHDETLAVVSHLPHLLAAAMGRVLVADSGHPAAWWLGSGSLRDATRVARSDGARVAEMVVPNRDALTSAASVFRAELERLVADLEAPARLRADLDEAWVGASRVVADVVATETVEVRSDLARALLAVSEAGEAVIGFVAPRTVALARRATPTTS
ncbi:Prephenate dehydrogenase [Acidimicrobium ferrooxidans DSM 10331]|uniref:Prephenate dehydrogenase n=1 Tax=Acidimicrobium ferrooxidans (strain DSM 10331 / JCM 15462 / NBRC 103882 / ICP) TaxID=525909 RepID=C7LZD2_ACIFD|nr:prephenate dehydrogenase/arogenate dehydrogenase family protein [Acidimicrobium ferrooxidans]ACU54090.1 Prephenate dehydrogenase [Acidimicrobium ferrooxidans DSM 10331]